MKLCWWIMDASLNVRTPVAIRSIIVLFVTCSEKFWSEFFETLSGQSRDGASLVYVTSALAQLPPVSLVDNVDAFRYTGLVYFADNG